MIVEMAKAKSGFINLKKILTEPTNNKDFEQCLRALFNFENVELLGFDGVRGVLESYEDLTNSLFICVIGGKKLLYQIQSCVPFINKNKLLQNFGCVLIETFDKIQEVLTNYPGSNCFGKIIQGIPQKAFSNTLSKKSEQKQNYIPKELIFLNIQDQTNENYSYKDFCTIRIKTMVNPFNSQLKATNPDGSFSFLFPICSNGEYFTNGITDGAKPLLLQDILEKYSTFIKSVEILPFLVNSVKIGNTNHSYMVASGQTYVSISNIQTTGFEYTELGIFVKSSNYSIVKPFEEVYFQNILSSLALGGGCNAYAQLPNGIFELNFAMSKSEIESDGIAIIPKTDGFLIAGKFSANINPCYINFYTDSSGQIYIQQQTNYRKELRDLNIENEFKSKQNLLNRGTSFVSNIATGRFFSAIGDITGFASDVASQSLAFEEQKQLFASKVQNDKAIAQLTGSQIPGDLSIEDFLRYLSNNFFAIIIETNYNKIGENYYCQEDYDYSVTYENTNSPTQSFLTNNVFDWLKYVCTDMGADFVGGNYNIVFNFVNKTNPNNFTNKINLSIRGTNKQKIL